MKNHRFMVSQYRMTRLSAYSEMPWLNGFEVLYETLTYRRLYAFCFTHNPMDSHALVACLFSADLPDE